MDFSYFVTACLYLRRRKQHRQLFLFQENSGNDFTKQGENINTQYIKYQPLALTPETTMILNCIRRRIYLFLTFMLPYSLVFPRSQLRMSPDLNNNGHETHLALTLVSA